MADLSQLLTPQAQQPQGLGAVFGALPAQPMGAQAAFERNRQFMRPGGPPYNTQLSPGDEIAFQQWVAKNKVPFNSKAPVTDYDMRGFWQAMRQGSPLASNAVDPNDGRLHYPDFWKTPYHQTFSNESQWANPATAPAWNERDQLVTPSGTVLYDDRAQSEE